MFGRTVFNGLIFLRALIIVESKAMGTRPNSSFQFVFFVIFLTAVSSNSCRFDRRFIQISEHFLFVNFQNELQRKRPRLLAKSCEISIGGFRWEFIFFRRSFGSRSEVRTFSSTRSLFCFSFLFLREKRSTLMNLFSSSRLQINESIRIINQSLADHVTNQSVEKNIDRLFFSEFQENLIEIVRKFDAPTLQRFFFSESERVSEKFDETLSENDFGQFSLSFFLQIVEKSSVRLNEKTELENFHETFSNWKREKSSKSFVLSRFYYWLQVSFSYLNTYFSHHIPHQSQPFL